MSEYFRSLGLYAAMFIMVGTLAGFIIYFSNVNSQKQDTYKEFMYSGMNKSTLRLQGAEALANGDINAYYLSPDGTYDQLNTEIVKQISIASKVDTKLTYELLYQTTTNEYFLHIESTEVDSVIKFKLEDGR